MCRVDCQASHTTASMPMVRVKITRTERAKSDCICPQYTTVIQVPPVNKLGIAVLSIDAPDTQSIHVISSQVACAPMDAIDCCDQLGCRKKAVYSTAVTAVQQALNRTIRMPILAEELGVLLL